MQNNISSNVPPVDIILAIAILGIAFIALYKLVSFINSRPDLIAFVGLAVIIIGGIGVVSGAADIVGGYMILGGALSFLLSAMIYSRNSKQSPTPVNAAKPAESIPAHKIDLTTLSKDQLIQILDQLGGAK